MQTVADQNVAPTTIRADLCAIFVSLELSRSTWLVTSLSPGRGEKMSKHSVSAGDIAALLARFSELRRKACARTGKSFPIVVIQEAGLDGFWIHRVLLSEGIESHSMVRAPTPEDEDRRRICRERKVLIMERVQHVNRIKGLLFSQGASGYEPLRRDRRARLEALQTGDGRRLPQHLKAQVCRELDRLELLLEQIKAVEAERDALLDAEQTKASAPPPMLLGVRGVGPEFASVLWSEGLSRHFDNRRQIAAYAGLAPTPWQSGSVNREQGISQSGNSRLRTTMIQLAWLWLRHQPRSALTLWFKDRMERNGGRRRKTTIVALARKLLVALWKYVSAGVVIEGAMIRPA